MFKPLAKSVLILLGLTTAASATDAAIHEKVFGFGTHLLDLGKRTALVILNEKINDVMKKVKLLEESGLLTKDVSEAIKNKAKEQKGRFLGMLLGT